MGHPTSARAVAAGLLACTACFGGYTPTPDQASTSSTSTDVQPETTGETTLSSTGAASTGDPPDPERIIGGPACHLDILFVVDFSASMLPFQNVLFEAVFGVVSSYTQTLSTLGSYNVGITSNSVVPWNAAAFVPEGQDASDCTGVGSLTRASNAECYEAFGGTPYLSEGGDLGTALSCIADSIASGGEGLETAQPITAIATALSAELNAAGQCNAGFHDPKDPLIVIVITASDDDVSPIPPVESGAEILLAVDLDPAKLAMSIVASATCACVDGANVGCGEPCPPTPDGPPDPPCSIVGLTDLLFAERGLEEHIRYTDICATPTERKNPFGDVFLKSLVEQASLVCRAAAD